MEVMAKFRKKPDEIQAVQVTAADFNPRLPLPHAWDGNPFDGDAGFLEKHFQRHALTPHNRGGSDYAQWDIETLEGTMTAQPGDWIIEGVNGEIYPCKPDIFEKTYEAVD
ncbi:hypothetical protein [Thalassospira povalilytica]|uniref:hypothetical protein n=1 Tax=Thalassospira povalilytica TaxID=732237 RepID=UPI003AA8476B